MKIVATSDLHLGNTTYQKIVNLANDIKMENPDLLLILGDVADGSNYFNICLQTFDNIGKIRIVTPGNHDLYDYNEEGSEKLYRKILPTMAENNNFIYGNVSKVIDDTTIIVTPGWCSGKFNTNGFNQNKIYQSYKYMTDSKLINMPFEVLHKEQIQWFELAIKNATTPKIIIGSHYPLFEELYEPLITPKMVDAYFYAPEFGEIIKQHSNKFESIIAFAGHVHRSKYKKINNNIECFIINSDYHAPTFISI